MAMREAEARAMEAGMEGGNKTDTNTNTNTNTNTVQGNEDSDSGNNRKAKKTKKNEVDESMYAPLHLQKFIEDMQ